MTTPALPNAIFCPSHLFVVSWPKDSRCSLLTPVPVCWDPVTWALPAASNWTGGLFHHHAHWQLLPGNPRSSQCLLFVLTVWSSVFYTISLAHWCLTSFTLKWVIPVKTCSSVPWSRSIPGFWKRESVVTITWCLHLQSLMQTLSN